MRGRAWGLGAVPRNFGSSLVCVQLPVCWGWLLHGPGSAKPLPQAWRMHELGWLFLLCPHPGTGMLG